MSIESRQSCNGASCTFEYRGVCDVCGRASNWYPNIVGVAQEGFAIDTSGGYGYRGVFCPGCRRTP